MANFFTANILPWAAKRGETGGPKSPAIMPGLYSQVPILELVQQAEQMADLGFWRYDLEASEVYWSPGVFAIHDLTPTNSVAIDNALCFYPPNHRPIMEAALNKAAVDGTSWDLELDFVSARAKKKRVRAIGQAEWNDGRVTALVGVFQDVTARYEADRQLRQAAMTDDLTGLPNRRHLHQFYNDLHLEKAPRQHVCYAFALIDLDHFKQVNDKHGHLAGDEILKQVAARLGESWLSNSFAARLGGDEFVLMIRDKHLLNALEETSERLLQRLAEPVRIGGETLEISATMGIAYVEQETQALSHLLSAADTMLYVAKKQKRGSCIIARGSDLFLDNPNPFAAIDERENLAKAG